MVASVFRFISLVSLCAPKKMSYTPPPNMKSVVMVVSIKANTASSNNDMLVTPLSMPKSMPILIYKLFDERNNIFKGVLG